MIQRRQTRYMYLTIHSLSVVVTAMIPTPRKAIWAKHPKASTTAHIILVLRFMNTCFSFSTNTPRCCSSSVFWRLMATAGCQLPTQNSFNHAWDVDGSLLVSLSVVEVECFPALPDTSIQSPFLAPWPRVKWTRDRPCCLA
jgi:hypothetical protein